MAPVVRISDRTWDRLKAWAVPLEDKPDDVINRVLDAAEASSIRKTTPNVSSGHTTVPKRAGERAGWQSRTDLYKAIVESLRELGGAAHVDEIQPRVEVKIAHLLRGHYGEPEANGQPRWVHAMHSARWKLVQKGVLKKDSQHGVWELNPNPPAWP